MSLKNDSTHEKHKPGSLIDKLVKKNTVEEDLRELNEQNDVVEIFADPYQMHRSITTLQAAGVPIKEYAQTQANCTLMGQTLFDLLSGQNLVLYPSDELRQQALSTVAVENPRGWRIAKEKASKKIDAIVALAMACVAANGAPWRDRQQVSAWLLTGPCTFKRKNYPFAGRAGLYRQTLVEVPATVIAQQSNHGSIHILAAFASEGMGLRRHVETVVKPWLTANARWALNPAFVGRV